MKNYLLLVLLSVLFSISGFAQKNLGFENWTNMGTYYDADNWNTSNLIAALGAPPSCLRAEPHWGSYSIGITPSSLFGSTFPGFAVQQYYYTQRPKSVSFYYKYSSNTADSGYFSIGFSKGPTADSSNPVGEAIFTLPHTNTWKLAESNITWYDNTIPDSATIFIINQSSDSLAKLLIDDIGISMFGLAVGQIQKPVFNIFLNSRNELNIDDLLVNDNATIIIRNMMGQAVLEQPIAVRKIDLNQLSSGTYAYEILSIHNTPVTGKFIR